MRRTPGGLIAFCTLMLGCSERSDVGDGSPSSEETGISAIGESDSGTGTEAPVWCTDQSCDAECSLVLDDCEQPMVGQCTSGTCHCSSSEPCVDCESNADCGQWRKCSPEFGRTICWTDWSFAWDPALACMLDLTGIDSLLIPDWLDVEIGEALVSLVDSCETAPSGMTIDGVALQLCPDACAAFEAAGSLVLEIHCPGGP